MRAECDARPERHFNLSCNVLYSHHGECAASDNDDHLPSHHIDEGEGEDEEEKRDGLFEVDAEDDR